MLDKMNDGSSVGQPRSELIHEALEEWLRRSAGVSGGGRLSGAERPAKPPSVVALMRLGPSEASLIAQLIDLFIAHRPAVPCGKGLEASYSQG
jgi:hypothetical protein